MLGISIGLSFGIYQNFTCPSDPNTYLWSIYIHTPARFLCVCGVYCRHLLVVSLRFALQERKKPGGVYLYYTNQQQYSLHADLKCCLIVFPSCLLSCCYCLYVFLLCSSLLVLTGNHFVYLQRPFKNNFLQIKLIILVQGPWLYLLMA